MHDHRHCRRRSTVPAILPERKEGWMNLLYSNHHNSSKSAFILHFSFTLEKKFNHTGPLLDLALSLLLQDRIQQH